MAPTSFTPHCGILQGEFQLSDMLKFVAGWGLMIYWYVFSYISTKFRLILTHYTIPHYLQPLFRIIGILYQFFKYVIGCDMCLIHTHLFGDFTFLKKGRPKSLSKQPIYYLWAFVESSSYTRVTSHCHNAPKLETMREF